MLLDVAKNRLKCSNGAASCVLVLPSIGRDRSVSAPVAVSTAVRMTSGWRAREGPGPDGGHQLRQELADGLAHHRAVARDAAKMGSVYDISKRQVALF